MTTTRSRAAGFFVTGGTLRADAPSYVERAADSELRESLLRGELCYVLTARQMGKSSLMVRTSGRLRQEGRHVVLVDVTALGQNLSAEMWYRSLLALVGEQLNLEAELEAAWDAQPYLGPARRWMAALTTAALPRCPMGLVVFIDEIDAVVSLPFATDELFAAIRACYNQRATTGELERLTFCLLGVAAPSDLIRDSRHTPFNIGRRIELDDFTADEAAPLALGLARLGDAERQGKQPEARSRSGRLLERVLYWTGGHPYLTQRLCRAVAERRSEPFGSPSVCRPADVDRACASLFFSPGAQQREDNLLFVRERLLRAEGDLAGLLELYAGVRRGRRIPDDEASQLVTTLRLAGITRGSAGRLCVRNRIYERVFSLAWVAAHMPDAELRRQRAAYRRGLLRASGIAGVIVTLLAAMAGMALDNARRMGVVLTDLWREQFAADSRAEEARKAREAEGSQRLLAVSERSAAEAARGLAEARGREAVRHREAAEERHVRLLVAAGMRNVDEGDLVAALLRFVEALRLDQGRPERERMHRIRIASVLERRPRLLQLWRQQPSIRVAISPNGQHIATVDSAGYVQLRNIRTGRVTPGLGRLRTSSLAFSPDSRRLLVTPEDSGAFQWEIATGRRVGVPLRNSGSVVGYGLFTPNGQRILTGAGDGSVRLWDADSGQPLTPPLRHQDRLQGLVVSRDGRWALSGSRDGTAQVLDLARSGVVSGVLRHPRQVTSVLFHPDNRRAAVAAAGQVWIWDVLSGVRRTFTSRGDVCLAFSADGKRLLTRSSYSGAAVELITWNADTGMPLGPPLELSEGIVDGCLVRDTGLVRTLTHGGVVETWDPTTSRRLSRIGLCGPVAWGRWTPDERYLVTQGYDGASRVWDLNTSAVDRALPGPPGASCSAFSPDGSLAAIGGRDGSIHVVDPLTGSRVGSPLKLAPGVAAIVFCPRSRLLAAAAGQAGLLRVWEARTGKPILSLAVPGTDLHQVSFSVDGGRIVARGAAGQAWLGDIRTGRIRRLQGVELGERPVFSPDGALLAGCDRNGAVSVFNTRGRKMHHLSRGGMHFCLFSPDGRRLVTSGVDGALRFWDTRTGNPAGAPIWHSGRVNDAEYSPDGRRLVTAGADATVRIWDATSGRAISLPISTPATSVAFSPDGQLLVTTTAEGDVSVWEAGTGELLMLPMNHRLAGQTVFSSDGVRLLSARGEGTAFVVPVPHDGRPVGELVRIARILSGREVNPQGAIVPLEPDVLTRDWAILRARYPADFDSTRAQELAWHELEARAAYRADRWATAVAHLSALAVTRPRDWELFQMRGRAHAKLGQWRPAARDFAASIRLGDDDYNNHYDLAVACLAAGDLPGYRQACRKMLDRFEGSGERRAEDMTAWTCALAPLPGADLRRALRIQERLLPLEPTNALWRDTYGSLLYRAGRCREARTQFEEALRMHNGAVPPLNSLFLAMTLHRLGEREEGRQWLSRAEAAIMPVLRDRDSELWGNGVELSHLLGEARQILETK